MKLQRNVVVDADGNADFTVSVGGAEDLWQLYNFITPGDIIGTKTVRKVARETATGSGTAERRVLTLYVLVENVDFDASGEPAVIRVAGVNRTDTEWVRMGAHHTLSIHSDPPQTVHIHKREWNDYLAARLREAVDEDARCDTAAIVMEYGSAELCLIHGTLVQTRAKIDVTIQKKHKLNGSSRDDSISKFFSLVYDALLANINFETVKVVLICSAGTIREEFLAYVNKRLQATETHTEQSKRLSQARSKLVPVLTTTGQRSAINEALADRTVATRVNDTKFSSEIKVWKRFEELLATDPDRVAYGPQYVHEAMRQQMVEVLLLSDSCFRHPDPRLRRYYFAMSEEVREYGGEVIVLSTQHTIGEALAKLSGVAAILRMGLPMNDVEQNPDFLASSDVDQLVLAHRKAQAEAQEMGSRDRTKSSSSLVSV